VIRIFQPAPRFQPAKPLREVFCETSLNQSPSGQNQFRRGLRYIARFPFLVNYPGAFFYWYAIALHSWGIFGDYP